MKLNSRLPILNIWVDPVSREEAVQKVHGYLEIGKRPHSIFSSNPEKNFSLPKDPELYKCYQEADLLLPDGIGIVFAANRLHGADLKRVPGSEFIFDICELAADQGYKVFIYGAKEAVNKRSVKILEEQYSSLKIVGRANGYVLDSEMENLIAEINHSGAEIIFLALGSPRQEKWFSLWRKNLEHVRVVQGIGGTLDTIGGDVKRAPAFWCRNNLEWFYRLLKEPKRIKRQWVLPLFTILVIMEWIKRKSL